MIRRCELHVHGCRVTINCIPRKFHPICTTAPEHNRPSVKQGSRLIGGCFVNARRPHIFASDFHCDLDGYSVLRTESLIPFGPRSSTRIPPSRPYLSDDSYEVLGFILGTSWTMTTSSVPQYSVRSIEQDTDHSRLNTPCIEATLQRQRSKKGPRLKHALSMSR
jgi:hypothetical protein